MQSVIQTPKGNPPLRRIRLKEPIRIVEVVGCFAISKREKIRNKGNSARLNYSFIPRLSLFGSDAECRILHIASAIP